jgi:hypothetical protein
MTDTGGIAGHSETSEQEEPKAGESKRWLAMIEEAETAFKDWQSKADNIDKLYANMNDLAAASRDRQFQMFWANVQVLAPSIYSRPPVPVVVPRFKARKPVPRAASEMLERCTTVGFETINIDGVMRLVRDDLTVVARGCGWVRYEDKKRQKVCIEFADRKDFLHGMARTWEEVPWVAKRSWLTEEAMEKRFQKHSGDAYKTAAYEERKDGNEKREGELKAGVWEIWHKEENKVVWVTEGVEQTLDEGEPHLDLEDFFPCPRPAYSTVQRRSLLPVPDMLFYKDQLEFLVQDHAGNVAARHSHGRGDQGADPAAGGPGPADYRPGRAGQGGSSVAGAGGAEPGCGQTDAGPGPAAGRRAQEADQQAERDGHG